MISLKIVQYLLCYFLSETPLQWSYDIFWNFENKKLLTMQEKTDFFFHYKICNFPSFLEILIDI